jgi:hypothetical protein
MKQIDVMKQALEALKRLKAYGNVFRFRQDEQNPYDQACEAIAILRTAIEQAERQQALDKKAENATELGLDYEPVQEPVTYTTGHCKEKAQPNGCQLHNLHCGYPACDRKTVAAPQPQEEHHAKDCALLQIPSKDCDCSQNQEPVAWMYDWTTSEGEFIQDWTTSEAETLRDTEPTIISNVRPLYLHPAKWQSLTLQEHYDLADKAGCMSADWIDYARAIEKALKEKNT